ncbi:universal stress protein [Jeotgalibaca caeni]|uniref:universal stress protein n=1 Tax=Jeotgalibaca caeni TaxID=3028623 RepID=UPI00237E01B1|nr:universal stress protein [Jeotgalibaca caeni]MDE1548829.1 universal stress protein [Jeotgalibaca caeni]
MLGEYTNLLVPVDGSEQADRSFKQAVAIAQRNKAKMRIVFVMDNRNVTIAPEYTPLHANDFQTDYDTSFMDDYLAYGKEAGVDIETTITNGNPMSLIADSLPEEYGTDLIVIGSTGKGAVTRALVGSVSNYVVKNAKCDVLVVRK